jgi:hypothetical protein
MDPTSLLNLEIKEILAHKKNKQRVDVQFLGNNMSVKQITD